MLCLFTPVSCTTRILYLTDKKFDRYPITVSGLSRGEWWPMCSMIMDTLGFVR